MSYPVFASGDVLNASDMNAVGLWLVKTQTIGSGVASVTVTGAFSADYDNYKIIVNGLTGSIAFNLQLKLGSSTANYYGFGIYGNTGGASVLGINDNAAARFGYVGGGDAFSGLANIDVINPYLAQQTQVQAWISAGLNFGTYAGRHADSGSYTSFILSPDGGTFSGGTISVYGYRK